MAVKSDYQLTAAEAEVLSAATKEIMGAVSKGVAPGAGIGARFGSRFLKSLTAEATVDAALEPDVCLTRAAETMAEAGAIIDNPNAVDDDGAVWGVVLSGAMNMMPALVRVQVTPQADGYSRVDVRATGNEGLIKQRIGAKAVDRIIEAIVFRD